MAWCRYLLRSWTDLTCVDEYLNYIDLFLKFSVLVIILAFTNLIIWGMIFQFLSCVSYMFKKMNNVPDDMLSNSWHKLRHFLSICCIKLGKMYYGYEIIGMEHVPEGPGIIIFYHGSVNVDYFLFITQLYVQKRKICIAVIDRLARYIPGIKPFLEMCPGIIGSKAECVEILNKGHLLAIAPGGGRETLFSDQYYNLLWGKRIGFAQVALEAKVPIIPMFTKNIQETYRGIGKTNLMRWLYENFRVACIVTYGGFPVKLRTYIGEPIPYDPNMTAVELAEKTKMAIENLRDQYQKIPGNILRAILERFDEPHMDD